MTVTFRNAPLVELIAELRWGDTVPTQPNAPLLIQGMGPDLDQFFMRFGGEVYQHGFQRAERLVPPGFPIFPFQPVFRYHKDAAADNSMLFQVGSGLYFSECRTAISFLENHQEHSADRRWRTNKSSVTTRKRSILLHLESSLHQCFWAQSNEWS